MTIIDKYLTIKEISRKIKFVLWFSAKYRKALFLLTASKLIEIPITLFLPLISAIVIDDCIIARDLYLFNRLVIVGVVFFIARMICDAAFSALSNNYNLRFGRDFQFYVLDRIMNAPYHTVNESSAGVVTSRVMEDANTVVQSSAMLLPNLLCQFINTIILLIICFSLNVPITILVLSLTPLNLLYSGFWGKKQYGVGLKQRQTIQELYSVIASYINSVREHKANRSVHLPKRFFRRVWLKNARHSLYMGFLNFVSSYGKTLSTGIFYLGINYYLLSKVIKGDISLGFFVAFLAYINMLAGNLAGYAGVYRNLLAAFPAFSRVFEFLPESPRSADRPKDIGKALTHHGIAICGLTYRHEDKTLLFDDLSLELGENRITVLTGDNGSGKTTLINLICGLLRPQHGRIYIGKYDVEEYHECRLRNNLAVIYCDNHIAGGATACGAARDAASVLPICDKASTGERFIGQFRRKIQNNPKILLLDEPLANLDEAHRKIVLEELKKLKSNATIFLTSHNWQDFQVLADAVYKLQDKKAVRIQ